MTIHYTNLASQDDAQSALKTPSNGSVYRRYGKRILDLTIILASALITLPVIALLALGIVLTGQSPFYLQERVGLNGKIFRIWKLQTMVPNAKERLEDYLAANPAARIEWDSKQKLTNDPRITRFGNFLRKSSLDELPQVFNVLNGSMSIIGPRPMMPEQKDDYKGAAYFSMRPGMSGFWQVSDRNACDFAGRVNFDECYSDQMSLGTDLRVIGQTVAVMLRGTGV